MRKNVLLLGAGGMDGHLVYFYLREEDHYNIANVVFRKKLTEDSIILDVTNRESVEALIFDQRPHIIINCIGILNKESKQYPDTSILINAYFPHFLKRLADQVDGKLIHISTDCVFSGKKGEYAVNDFKDADDIYGRSKALGEIINNKDLTIRTSLIGPELKNNGEGLFHWFMNQNGVVDGYTEAFWGGVTTLELAKAIDEAITDDVSGIVHLTNGDKISKYDLLLLFKQIWEKSNAIIKPAQEIRVDKSLQKTLSFDHFVPSYSKMLIELHDWMKGHRVLYDAIYSF